MFLVKLTGLVMFHFRCRIEVANLQPVTTCELVHDIEETVTDESSTDDENTTLMTRAEDVTGKPCCIVYEECLLKIAKMKVIIVFLFKKNHLMMTKVTAFLKMFQPNYSFYIMARKMLYLF